MSTPIQADEWKLSSYELQRSPHELTREVNEIAVSQESLQDELKCPLCLSLFQETTLIKECLHRFCSKCLTTYLHLGKKDCPICGTTLESKLSLQSDPHFDLLISKIYPRNEYIHAEGHSSKLNLSSASHNVLAGSIKESIDDGSSRRTEEPMEIDYNSQLHPNEVELIFKPLPKSKLRKKVSKSDNESVRYLKTTANASVGHLTKYLGMRASRLDLNIIMSEECQQDICLYVSPEPGRFDSLVSSQTLRQIKEKFSKANQPLEIYYTWKWMEN